MNEQEINQGAASIGNDLFGGGEEPVEAAPEPLEEGAPIAADEGAPVAEAPVDAEAAPVEEEVSPAPKSWPKEMHEHWGKTPKEVRDYWQKREAQMLDGIGQCKEMATLGDSVQKAMTPYIPMLRAAGANPVQAIETLLDANYKLTSGSMEDRRNAFIALGKNLGLINPQQQQTDNIPPELQKRFQTLQSNQERINAMLMAREREAYQARYRETESSVNDFAKDAPYFDEVADDIVAYVNAGHDLKSAYERAVYANPVTRAKEMARLQKETQAKLVEKGKQEAQAARKATAANVNGRDTGRAPTELLGTMEDTMRATLKNIQSRTH